MPRVKSTTTGAGFISIGSGEYVYRFDADTGATVSAQPYHLTTLGAHGETYATVVNAAPTIVPGLGLNGEGPTKGKD